MLLYSFIRAGLGINISRESWGLCYITVVSSFIAIKLLVAVLSLFWNKDRENYYENISLKPLILLAFIPSTAFYYFCLIPHYILLEKIILGNFEILRGYLVEFDLILVKQYIFKSFKSIFHGILGHLFTVVHCSSDTAQ